jgi:hypothetical protein
MDYWLFTGDVYHPELGGKTGPWLLSSYS